MFDIFQNVLGFLAGSSFLFSLHQPPPPVPSLTFQLRHEHALTDNSRNVFSDIPSAQVNAYARMDKVFRVKTQDIGLHRPTAPSVWSEMEVPGPNVSDRETLRQLAMMTNNAYEENATSKDWYDLGPDWNSVSSHFSGFGRATLALP
jgi:putative lipase involved disintegration of autophagic bodies